MFSNKFQYTILLLICIFIFQDDKSPKTDLIELSENENNKYSANDSLDIDEINLDHLRINTCKAENIEQYLTNALEGSQDHSAKVKEEKMQYERADLFEVSDFPSLNECHKTHTVEIDSKSKLWQIYFAKKIIVKHN